MDFRREIDHLESLSGRFIQKFRSEIPVITVFIVCQCNLDLNFVLFNSFLPTFLLKISTSFFAKSFSFCELCVLISNLVPIVHHHLQTPPPDHPNSPPRRPTISFVCWRPCDTNPLLHVHRSPCASAAEPPLPY